MDFDLQSFLSEMRAEMHEGFKASSAATTTIADDLKAHQIEDVTVAGETNVRLSALEGLHTSVRWVLRAVIGAGIVGFITIAFDVLRNHWR